MQARWFMARLLWSPFLGCKALKWIFTRKRKTKGESHVIHGIEIYVTSPENNIFLTSRQNSSLEFCESKKLLAIANIGGIQFVLNAWYI